MDSGSDDAASVSWTLKACAWMILVRLTVADSGYIFPPGQTSGAISSPNYPFNYTSPQSFNYTFLPSSSDNTVRICFDFRRFHLGNDQSRDDYLEFPSGYCYFGKGRLVARHRHSSAAPPTVWNKNFCWQTTNPGVHLVVRFVSNSGYSSLGFFAYFKPWSYHERRNDPDCKLELDRAENTSNPASGTPSGGGIRCDVGSLCNTSQDPIYSCPDVEPCSSDEFTCFNRKCIPKSRICDNSDDCGDQSDETYAHARCRSRDLLRMDAISCDFELDSCGFLGLSSWKRVSGYGSEPAEDHTIGNAGHYLRTDFSEDPPGTTISFFSQTMDAIPPEGLCFSFWYYIVSDNTRPPPWSSDVQSQSTGTEGGLFVVRFGRYVVWKTEWPTDRWHSAAIFIPRDNSLRRRKIRFEATRGNSGVNVMALDDIFLHKGQCNQVLEPSCTYQQGYCGWSQYNQGDLALNNSCHWHLYSNKSCGSGRSLYLEVTSPLPDNQDLLSIRSPYVTPGAANENCVRLRLYTSSSDILVELKQETRTGKAMVVWSNVNDARSGCTGVAATITPSELFTVVLYVLRAAVGDSLAIDDFSITTGRCMHQDDTKPSPPPCPVGERPKWCDDPVESPDGHDDDDDDDYETIRPGSELGSSAIPSLPVFGISVISSIAFVLLVATVTLVYLCVVTLKRRRHYRDSILLSSRPFVQRPSATDHVTSPGYGHVPPRSAKWRPSSPGGVQRASEQPKNPRSMADSAFSVDGSQYSCYILPTPMNLFHQPRYTDPPPSYASVTQGTLFSADSHPDPTTRDE